MQIHQLKPIHKNKKRKRVGRGGKKGTYSGKGIKGQKARAGRKFAPVIRELIKKYPKLRGYRMRRVESNIAVVNFSLLEKHFNDLEIVSPQILLNRGLIRRIKGKVPKVKILGKGKLVKKLVFKNCLMSKSAKKEIEGIKS